MLTLFFSLSHSVCVCGGVLLWLIQKGDETRLPNLGSSKEHMQSLSFSVSLALSFFSLYWPPANYLLGARCRKQELVGLKFPPVSQYLLCNWLLMSNCACVSMSTCLKEKSCVRVCVYVRRRETDGDREMGAWVPNICLTDWDTWSFDLLIQTCVHMNSIIEFNQLNLYLKGEETVSL